MTHDPAFPSAEQIDSLADEWFEGNANSRSMYDMLKTLAAHLRESEPVAGLWVGKGSKYINHGYSDRPAIKQLSPGNYLLYTTPPSAADAEDARRYRWLRSNNIDSFDGTPHILSWHTGCNNVYFGEAADKAIDAAMQGEK